MPSARRLIRFGALFSALLLACIGLAAQQYRRAEALEEQLALQQLYALEEAAAGAVRLDLALEKSCFAGTPLQRAALAARIWREAGAVKAALSVLPMTGFLPENTYLFLSQVGEYAMSLSNRALRGETLPQEELQQLASLREYAAAFSRILLQLETDVASGSSRWEELCAEAAATAAEPLPQGDTSAGPAGLTGMEAGFEGYAALTYDGPFSDHLLDTDPRFVEGMPMAERTAARATAAAMLGCSESDLQDGYDENSALPLYCFTADSGTAAVSQQGGCPVSMSRLPTSAPADEPLDTEEAIAAARRWLQQRGYDSMQASYHQLAEGILTVNFAYLQDGVTCYTDLIKVGVALDTGEIVFFDARGFLFHHTARPPLQPTLSRAEAVASLSPQLSVRSSRIALIPTAGGREVLTYEFLCRGPQGEQVLVYVNAGTGAEEQLLLLTEDEHGLLTA